MPRSHLLLSELLDVSPLIRDITLKLRVFFIAKQYSGPKARERSLGKARIEQSLHDGLDVRPAASTRGCASWFKAYAVLEGCRVIIRIRRHTSWLTASTFLPVRENVIHFLRTETQKLRSAGFNEVVGRQVERSADFLDDVVIEWLLPLEYAGEESGVYACLPCERTTADASLLD